MKLCWAASRHGSVPPDVVGPQQRGELGARPRLGAEQAGEEHDDLLQARADRSGSGLNASSAPLPSADEDDLGGQVGELRVRVVRVPDDLGRRPVDPEQVEQGAQVPLRLGGRAAAERARRGAAWGPRARAAGLSQRHGVEEEEGRAPLADVGRQVVDLLLGQRRGLGHQQDVEVRRGSGRRARPS